MGTHAIEEMAEDKLESDDIENVVLNGTISRRFTQDPRGTRYEVSGWTADGRLSVRLKADLLADGFGKGRQHLLVPQENPFDLY